MANTTTTDLINLDPDLAKQSLVNFMSGQATFKSYDFAGSNMNAIISLLGVNTFKYAVLMNMINSESHLDSAQTRSAVVSEAKSLNYLPRSRKSAEAIVTVQIPTNGLISSVVIPKGTNFTSRAGTSTFQFTTADTLVATSANNLFTIPNLPIFEGSYLTDSFVVDVSQPNQRFIISNQNIDTSSLTVTVIEDNGATTYEYKLANSLLGVGENDLVYFLQCSETENYEVLFGNDLFGREPQNAATVRLNYRVSAGEAPNGAGAATPGFALARDLTGGNIQGTMTVTTVQTAQGGAERESIESIRFMAPRHFETQERAVGPSDYETLLKGAFPEIQAVAVFGGETVSPPQYGRVIVSVAIQNVIGLPESKQSQYGAFLAGKTAMLPVLVAADDCYAAINSTIFYDITQTTLSPNDIETLVASAIVEYGVANLNVFNVTMKYSQFVKAIDAAHPSIDRNDTDLFVYKKISPRTTLAVNINVDFAMALFDNYPPTPSSHPLSEVHTVWSSDFVYKGVTVHIEDDGQGVLRIVRTINANDVAMVNIGTVDYTTGKLSIASLVIDQYTGQYIKIYARPATKDITVSGNNILTIEPAEITLDAQAISVT